MDITPQVQAKLDSIAQRTAVRMAYLFRSLPSVGEDDVAQECRLKMVKAVETQWDPSRGTAFLWTVAHRAVTHLYERTIREARRVEKASESAPVSGERQASALEVAESLRVRVTDNMPTLPVRRGRPGYPLAAMATALAVGAAKGWSLRDLADNIRADADLAHAVGFTSSTPCDHMAYFDGRRRLLATVATRE